MGEFAELRCNSLDLSPQCKQIFECVQADKISQFSILWNAISEEITTDFPLPMAMIGLLLLLQLKNNERNQERQ